jgi:hypothetical protein
MLRPAARLLTGTTVLLALALGAQPAQAAGPADPMPDGFLCKILKISCP